MDSKMFTSALGALADGEQDGFASFEDWLREFGDRIAPTAGQRLQQNIRAEAHLTGDAAYGATETFTEFLRECSKLPAQAAGTDGGSTYVAICNSFQMCGTPVLADCVPEALARYSMNPNPSLRVIARILGESTIRDILDEFTTIGDALQRIKGLPWDPNALAEDDLLSDSEPIFATFQLTDDVRGDMRAVLDALALPLRPRRPGDVTYLIEFIYTSGSVGTMRFPTVADAGVFPEFKPSAEAMPHSMHPSSCTGWTEPRSGQAPQPEVVHANVSLRATTRPPAVIRVINW